MTDLTILMLTTRFPPDHGGGAQQAFRLCLKLAERNVGSFVITGHKGAGRIQEEIEGIPVTRLPLPKSAGAGVLPGYARWLRLLWQRRRQYHILHAHAIHHHAYAGFLAGRLLGKPAIAKMAGLTADTPNHIRARTLGNLQVKLLSQATRLIATSQELHDATIRQGFPAERLVKIPNGTDIGQFYPVDQTTKISLRTRLNLPPKALLATFVGAVRPVKGVDLLAQGWPKVATAVPNLHICLVGAYRQKEHWGIDPAYVTELRQLFAREQDGEQRIHFVGQVANVPDYLQASDFFIFPSRSEGMPNALLEAMACGLPYVATNLDCIEEVSPPAQRPYLVPVDNVNALAEAIITLAGDVETRRQLGTAVRQTIVNHYSLDTVADQYVTLYHQLLER